VPEAGSVPEGRIVIRLTQGNLSHSHVYLRNHLDFFLRMQSVLLMREVGGVRCSHCTSLGFPRRYRVTPLATRSSSAAAVPGGHSLPTIA
jgi:hypothetical protein